MTPRHAVQTFTGVLFDVFDPDPIKIDLRDIAHALANKCRFNGHCLDFYSVAEHSLRVAEAASHLPLEYRQWALLHDAAEAYLCDLPTPIKSHPLLAGFRDIERGLEKAICIRFFGKWLPEIVDSAAIKELDLRALSAERERLMLKGPDWGLPVLSEAEIASFVRFEIGLHDPEAAEMVFLDYAADLRIK